MAEKHPKRPRDPNQWAKRMADIVSGEVEDRAASPQKASAGAKGGQTRAARLTPEQRAEAAKLAAQVRWRKKG